MAGKRINYKRTDFCRIIPSVDARPGTRLFADHKLLALDIEGDACNTVREGHALQLLISSLATPKVYRLAGSDGQDRQTGPDVCRSAPRWSQGDKLARLDLGFKRFRSDTAAAG